MLIWPTAATELQRIKQMHQTNALLRKHQGSYTTPRLPPKIAEAEGHAHRAVEKVLDRYVVPEERVAEALAKIEFYDIRDLFSWTEDRLALKASTEISDAASFAISEICQLVTENGCSTIRIKLADRRAA
jgi:hypothetical protein